MVAGVNVVEMIFLGLGRQIVRSECDVVHPGTLAHVHPGGGEDVVGAAVEQERLTDNLVVIPRGGGLSCKAENMKPQQTIQRVLSELILKS